MKTNRMGWIKIIVTGATLGLAVLLPACHEKVSAAQTRDPVTSELDFNPEVKLTEEQKHSPLISFVQVSAEKLDQTLEVTGAMASDTDHVTQFRPPLSGRIQELLVTVGDLVEKGQPVAKASGGAVIKAPVKGMVLGIYSKAGDTIDPLIPFMTLADTAEMRCVFDVFERDVGQVHKGNPVTLKVTAFPQEIFAGQIAYISPRVNESSRTVKVSADIENPDGRIKFGMFASGKIVVGSVQALVIPESAIQEIDGKQSVFVLTGPETLTVRQIETGLHADGHVEVKSGLKAGDTIVGQGSFMIKSSSTS